MQRHTTLIALGAAALLALAACSSHGSDNSNSSAAAPPTTPASGSRYNTSRRSIGVPFAGLRSKLRTVIAAAWLTVAFGAARHR